MEQDKKVAKELVKLWSELIKLDDKSWTSKNWDNYSKEWDMIKAKAVRVLATYKVR